MTSLKQMAVDDDFNTSLKRVVSSELDIGEQIGDVLNDITPVVKRERHIVVMSATVTSLTTH